MTMTTENRTLRADMKGAIKSTATEIRANRAHARANFAEARRLHAAGDEKGAATVRARAWEARDQAEALAPVSRSLLLAYALIRGIPLSALERTRKRAPAPTADMVLAGLRHISADGELHRAACEAWIKEGLETPAAPASRTSSPRPAAPLGQALAQTGS